MGITEEKEKDKEIDEKVEKIKSSEKTTEEEESAEADILLASDDEEIKEAKIDDNSKKESEEILSPKSREERAKYKASLAKKGKKNSEVIDKKELENSEPEIETIESDDDAIAEALETESNNKKKVDTTEVTLVDDTPDDSNSIEEINDETPADSIAQICTPVPAVRSLDEKQPVRKEKPKATNLMASAMAKAQKMAEDAVECVDLSSDDENADTGNGTSRSRKTKVKA